MAAKSGGNGGNNKSGGGGSPRTGTSVGRTVIIGNTSRSETGGQVKNSSVSQAQPMRTRGGGSGGSSGGNGSSGGK